MNSQAQANLNLFNSDARVRAFEIVIRKAEGTYNKGDNGYNVFFGGSLFSSYTRHPNVAHTVGRLTSTAAGGHQWLYSTWQPLAQKLALTDFSPQSQIIGFVEKLRERGALSKLLANDFDGAIRASNKEWASLPESPYGQGTQTWATVRNWYQSALGQPLTAGSYTNTPSQPGTSSVNWVAVIVGVLILGKILRG